MGKIRTNGFLIGLVFSILLVCSSWNFVQIPIQIEGNIEEQSNQSRLTDSIPKESVASGVPTWITSWGNTANDFGHGIWTDGSNIFTCGYTFSYGAGQEDLCLIKWTTGGVLLWNKTWGNTNRDIGRAVWANDTVIYTCGSTVSYGSGGWDILLIKWDQSGNPLWYQTWGISADDSGMAVWANSTSVYVCGSTYSGGYGGSNLILIKYDCDGNKQWESIWGGINDETGSSVWGDDNDAIYTCGSTTTFGAGSSDIALVKWDTAGNKIWNFTWGGSSFDIGTSVWGDSTGIYTCGNTQSFGAGNNDLCLVKWDTTGSNVWSRVWGGASDDFGNSIWGNNSALYTCGYTDSFGTAGHDLCLIKWDLSGTKLWNRTWGGFGGDWGTSVWGDNNSIYTCGYTDCMGTGGEDICVVKWAEREVPTAPILDAITPNPNTDGNIVLNWNIVSEASSYKIYQSHSPITSTFGLTPMTSTTNSYTDKITSNSTYYYAVTAVNASGESDLSNCRNVVVQITSNKTTNTDTSKSQNNETQSKITAYPFVVFSTILICSVLILMKSKSKYWKWISH